MARIHSSSKGQSISIKPNTTTLPELTKPVDQIMAEIISLAKSNHTASDIGIHLRDIYGIGNSKDLLGKGIGEFLKENNAAPKIPEDLSALSNKANNIIKHLKKNNADKDAKRRLANIKARAARLITYFKRKGVLKQTFKLTEVIAKAKNKKI